MKPYKRFPKDKLLIDVTYIEIDVVCDKVD